MSEDCHTRCNNIEYILNIFYLCHLQRLAPNAHSIDRYRFEMNCARRAMREIERPHSVPYEHSNCIK